jgi:hypothetical protein
MQSAQPQPSALLLHVPALAKRIAKLQASLWKRGTGLVGRGGAQADGVAGWLRSRLRNVPNHIAFLIPGACGGVEWSLRRHVERLLLSAPHDMSSSILTGFVSARAEAVEYGHGLNSILQCSDTCFPWSRVHG